MNEFSSNDINEAKKRVEEMRRRSFDYIGNFDDNNNPDSKNTTAANESKARKSSNENKQKSSNPVSDLFSNLFGSFSSEAHDSSDFLILALILILSKEGADNKLILALLYILL